MSPERRVWVLADVDAMYTSVERVFQPHLAGRPLVVLSNNDGCVIARSAEAKQLGITMGQPWFQLARRPLAADVAVRSANFALYGDFSCRLLMLADQVCAWVEPYSIDECFLWLPAAQARRQAALLRARARQWLGLPVSMGIAATKTLAKLAARQAKNTGAGVHDLTAATSAELAMLLAATPTVDVWGVGVCLAARLAHHGIHSAADLASADTRWLRRLGSVTTERTARELRGQSCLPLTIQPPPRRQMLHTRHLGQPLTHPQDITDCAAAFAAALAARLRPTGLAATTLAVHLSTGASFYPGPHTSGQATQALPIPASATGPLATTAAHLARQLWRPGYRYRRVGVLALDLAPSTPGLWGTTHQHDQVAAVIDAITRRHGHRSIGLGHAGLRHPPAWASRQQHLSPACTTQWDQLPTAHR